MRLGTRGSALALAQADWVARAIEGVWPGREADVVTVRTSGDERPTGERPTSAAPRDKSRFVKEIEDALLAGEVDLAVHSAKDLPGELPEGLAIVGVPRSERPEDSVCGPSTIDDLPEGATVGTSSLRRRAQLLARRPDLRVRELRGNVDTRLRRLEAGDYDALVVAAAGLARLGLEAGSPIGVDALTPAPGQGCLALEARRGDAAAMELSDRLTDRDSLVRLTAERVLVARLEATCRTPIGAHASHKNGSLSIATFVGLPDGSEWIRDSVTGSPDDPTALGESAADRLSTAGAGELLAAADRWDESGDEPEKAGPVSRGVARP